MAKAMTAKQQYANVLAAELQKDLGIKNKMAVPKIEKVKISVGIGSYVTSGGGSKDYNTIVDNVALIAGQKPVVNKSRIAISNFKLRIGMPVGVSVTLRSDRAYDFLSKLVNIVLPRVRDFRGISKKGMDGNGNYSLGIKEHIAFPEINPDDIARTHGVQITVVTSAEDDEQGLALLTKLGFPFEKKAEKKS